MTPWIVFVAYVALVLLVAGVCGAGRRHMTTEQSNTPAAVSGRGVPTTQEGVAT